MGWIFATDQSTGRGIAGEACRAVLDWADAHLQPTPIWAIISPANAPSFKLAERLGFERFARQPSITTSRSLVLQRAGALSLESRNPGDRAADDQRMDVVRALIGVDRLEVRGVAHDLEFGADAVAAMHVAGDRGRYRAPCRNCCA